MIADFADVHRAVYDVMHMDVVPIDYSKYRHMDESDSTKARLCTRAVIATLATNYSNNASELAAAIRTPSNADDNIDHNLTYNWDNAFRSVDDDDGGDNLVTDYLRWKIPANYDDLPMIVVSVADYHWNQRPLISADCDCCVCELLRIHYCQKSHHTHYKNCSYCYVVQTEEQMQLHSAFLRVPLFLTQKLLVFSARLNIKQKYAHFTFSFNRRKIDLML